jgi:hypothetical protein
MSVERENAVVDNTIILRNNFRYSQTQDLFDPSAISKVEILDSDGGTVIETITGANIIKDSTGKYHVVASAVATAKTIYDKWSFTPAVGATAITKTNTCIVWAFTAEPGGGTLVVGTNSWASLQEAEDYFITRFGIGTSWSGLLEANKVAVLISSYNALIGSGLYDFPAEVVNFTSGMKKAQCEMALFLIIHQADMDVRMGLQAQGVNQAGIVQETYGKEVDGIPIPPIVRQLLKSYITDSDIHVIGIERNEDEDVS